MYVLKQDELPRKGELHTTTSLLQSCPSPGGRGGNVWTGELFSTQKSSEELINCWLFPCFVIRKHPEGAGTQEVVLEEVGNPCSHPTPTYLYSLHFFYHWLFSLKTHPHWSVPPQGYCQRQQRDQTSRQELGPSSGSRGKVNDISPLQGLQYPVPASGHLYEPSWQGLCQYVFSRFIDVWEHVV